MITHESMKDVLEKHGWVEIAPDVWKEPGTTLTLTTFEAFYEACGPTALDAVFGKGESKEYAFRAKRRAYEQRKQEREAAKRHRYNDEDEDDYNDYC